MEKIDISGKHPSHWFSFDISYSLAGPIKRREKRGREALIPLRWSRWLVDLFKCAVYMSVLNVLTSRGTVEQLATAVPERLTRGSRAHSVSCWQIPTNREDVEGSAHMHNIHHIYEHPYPSNSLFCGWEYGRVTAGRQLRSWGGETREYGF